MHDSMLLVGFLICILPAVISADQPKVQIEQGILTGSNQNTLIKNRSYASFEGIPYAEAPIGDKRFKESSPAKPWTGIFNATTQPPKCLQVLLFNETSVKGSEDCLYLNVYTPKLPPNCQCISRPLDVILFIHERESTSTDHNPKLLLDEDVVFVTANFRLGPLGFLSTGDDVAPGNYGLKDQLLALKWVQKNIGAFGGNPKSVTIAGFSSGSDSVHLHLLSPQSKGLFKGAILMSGVALNPWAIQEKPKEKAIALAKELGCATDNTLQMVDCMRKVPADKIITSSDKLKEWPEFPSIDFAPVIEPAGSNAFISQTPEEILKNKGAMDVPLLMSYTAGEGLGFGGVVVNNPPLLKELLDRWDELAPVFLSLESIPSSKKPLLAKKTKEYYKIDNSSKGTQNLLKLSGDDEFVYGIGKAAKLHASLYKSPVYMYKFSYRGKHSLTELQTKKNIGVSHGDDTLYLVGSPLNATITTAKDKQMSKQMIDTWVKFAANGKLDWKPVGSNLPKITYADIEGPGTWETVVVDEVGEEKFWDSLMAEVN